MVTYYSGLNYIYHLNDTNYYIDKPLLGLIDKKKFFAYKRNNLKQRMLNLFNEKFNRALKFSVLEKQNNSLKQTKEETFDQLIKGDLSSKSFSSRYYLPENKQWLNSIYMYNKSNTKSLPSANNLTDKLLRSFFNLINDIKDNFTDKKSSQKRSLGFFWRKNRPSINKVWLSKSETKHTNDKVIITIYMYNKKRNILIYKLKQLYRNIFSFNRRYKYLSFLNMNKKKILISAQKSGIILNKNSSKFSNVNGSFNLTSVKQINEKLLSYKDLSNEELYKPKKQAKSSKIGTYSMFDSNKLNNKFNIFTYIYTPSTKFLHNRPYFFSKTPNSTKFQVSSFIDGIKKNTSITDYYTAFLNRYHLKHIVKGINNSNVKKVVIPVSIGAKYGYLNNVRLLKNNKILYNLTNNPSTMHCSELLSKLYLLLKQSRFHMSATTEEKKNYVSLEPEKMKKKNISLIKLYKYVYIIHQYKNNNNAPNKILTSDIELKNIISSYKPLFKKQGKKVLSFHYEKSKPKIKPEKKVKKNLGEIIKKYARINLIKKLKKNIKKNIYKINKLSTFFNHKRDSFFNSISKFNGKANPIINKTMLFSDHYTRNIHESEIYNYVTNVYRKEISYLNTIKNINFYSYICKNFFLTGLKNIISKIYKKRVEFNIVNLKYIYLNSDIFTQSLTKKLRNRRNKLLRLLKKSLNSVSMPNKNGLFYYKKNKILFNRNFMYKYSDLASYTTDISNHIRLEEKDKKIINTEKATISKTSDSLNQWIYNSFHNNFQPLDLNKKLNAKNEKNNRNRHSLNSYKLKKLEKLVIDSIKYKSMFGVRLEATGRLTRRLTASRSVFKFKYIGSLRNTNSLNNPNYSPLIIGVNKPNIQFTKITSKTRNGSFGIKGWVSGH